MATDPAIGTTVGGCEILDVLGQGGMGVIYKARQKSLDRIVALKVLAPHLANNFSFVARFQTEARAIAKVNHPNILAVYDVGDDNHVNYMIMELVEGQSLADMQTDRRGAIPWEEATEYIRQAAQGLEAAQAAGIVHRDIKPENLMLTKKNTVKVSDFGLAKEADAAPGATSVDAVMGTPAFMSPEQCDGKKLDARSDIYSLGGSFYRLVTGRLPFEAETAMSMMYRHKHEALIPPHEVVNSVPPAISAVIVKMMAKRCEHRYQTMTEVLDALDAARKAAALPLGPGLPAAVSGQREAVRSQVLPGLPPLAPPPAGESGPRFDMSGVDATDPALRPPARPGSQRMPVAAASHAHLPAADSSSGLRMPSGTMGMSGHGLSASEECYQNVARGDELLTRGDRLAGLRYYRQALQAPSLDQATRDRVAQEIQKELGTRRQAMENLLKRGMLVEASRECRLLVELDPADELMRNALKDLDTKLATKRTMINDLRTAIAASAFEKAIKIWDTTPAELRDEGHGKQVEQLRTVVVPALKLAEQGESFSHQGRLEEAVSSFEDALKTNPNCEPARIGQKETLQKLQRIEFLLKEGFQHSQEQDYAKAVETWRPILELRPGHAQAMKSIVDACAANGQQLRARGDLEGALAAYQVAAETDPQNRNVKRLVEDLTNLRDKEQALIDRAQDAAARNRLSAALGYWQEVQRLNPASKRAAQQLAELGRQRTKVWLAHLLVAGVLAAAGVSGWLYYSESRALGAADEAIHKGQYREAH
ncbi:MAG: protein kinase, partial [Planctomycetota bacterium]